MNEISHIGNTAKQNRLNNVDILGIVYESRDQITALGERYASTINDAISDMIEVVSRDPSTSADNLRSDFASVIDAIQSGVVLPDVDLFSQRPGESRESVSTCEIVPTDPDDIKTADVIDIFRARKSKID
ncbi:MAG: hypothetical protein EOO17_01845 [Chloroflexi bacterium]|nr:MAG: hypothetical protein EOO17_01845 [Chloroflexota bacterium]